MSTAALPQQSLRKRRTNKAKAEAQRAAVKDILVGYRRVSTDEQAESGAGLTHQQRVIEAWATFKGKQLIWLEDEGESAGTLDRPGLQKALDLVRDGQAGGIVVAKLDRLSRSMFDFVTLMKDSQENGWDIIAIDFDLDTSTAVGQMMIGILALFAEFERNIIKQRTKDALAEKKAAGVQIGRRRSMPDEVLTAVIATWLGCDRNYTWACERLNRDAVPRGQGGKQWWASSVRAVVISADGQSELQRQLNVLPVSAALVMEGATP